jgi:hypothetical protein
MTTHPLGRCRDHVISPDFRARDLSGFGTALALALIGLVVHGMIWPIGAVLTGVVHVVTWRFR